MSHENIGGLSQMKCNSKIITLLLLAITVIMAFAFTAACGTNGAIAIELEDMDLEDGATTDINVLADAEIEGKYQIALEAISWFHLTTMPVDVETSIEVDDRVYWLVTHETISTFAELETHLGTIFTGDVVSELLRPSYPRYRDIEGVLYAIGADRGTNIFAGDEVHEIIRVTAYEIIYRVSVDIFDDAWLEDHSAYPVDVQVNDFHLILVDGNWLFSNFHMVR